MAAATAGASPVRVSLLSSSSDDEDGAGPPGPPPQQQAGSIHSADSDDEDTAAGFEIIELLDDSDDDSDVIELLDSDSEDADDDDDVVLVASLPPPTATAAGSSRQWQQQTSRQPQWQQQSSRQPPPPSPRQARHAIHIYVDGSHRPRATNKFAMSAGVWAAGGALKLARNLHGGVADSVRAELGAILAAMEHIQAGGLGAAFTARQAAAAARAAGAMPAAAQPAAQPAAVEVHLLTDCQACCSFLGPGERVNAKYVALVARIRSLKAALPFRVRLFKVKGHSRGRDAHAVGNRAADQLARCCDAHQPLVLLPA